MLPRKKSFSRNKSGGRQLVEMHGVRSVKGKAKSAEQFRLECVYADASLFLSHLLLFSFPRAYSFLSSRHSRSYYFSSVLVTIGTPERRKRASKEGKINRESGCEAETVSRKRVRCTGRERKKTRGRHGWQGWCVGVARGAVRVLSPGESAEVGVEKRGKGLGN